jgi:hypothetical protein
MVKAAIRNETCREAPVVGSFRFIQARMASYIKCLSSAHSIAAKYISSSGRLRGFIYDYLLNQAAVSYIMMAIKPTSDRPESSWAGEKIQGIKPILYFPVRRHGLTSRPGPIRSRSAKGSLIG